MNRLLRKVFLAFARNPWMRERLPTLPFMQKAVRRFMPGDTIEDALGVAVDLQAAGIGTMYTRLGENIDDAAQAQAVADHYLEVLDRIQAAGIDGEISVKPTQLGPRHRRGHVPRPPADPVWRGGGRGVVPVDRHGGQQLRRPDPRPLPAAPLDARADRHLPPGLPAADGAGRGAAAAARPGGPARQGRLRRAGQGRLPVEQGGRRQLRRARGHARPGEPHATDPARASAPTTSS